MDEDAEQVSETTDCRFSALALRFLSVFLRVFDFGRRDSVTASSLSPRLEIEVITLSSEIEVDGSPS